jgi:hypothetical protein
MDINGYLIGYVLKGFTKLFRICADFISKFSQDILNILSYPTYPFIPVSYPLISLGTNSQMLSVVCYSE